MSGGLLQLVSIGKQDLILMENPEISFFKTVYKKPTLFSIENIYKKIELSTFNQTINIPVPNYGDLLKNINLKLELPPVQFTYSTPIDRVIELSLVDDLYRYQINSIYFNINILRTIELLLYNNIRAIARSENNLKIFNQLTKLNDATIYLNNSSITLLFDEISLNHNLIYKTYDTVIQSETSDATTIIEKIKDINITNYAATSIYDKNNTFYNIINQTNLNNLLTGKERTKFKTILDNITNIKTYEGNDQQNYITDLVTNTKLEITNIIQSDFNLYLFYINLSKYLEKSDTSFPINVIDNIIIELIKNLQYAIIQLDEIYSYHTIINTPSIDITSINPDPNNMYFLTTNKIEYQFPLLIIIENDGNTTYKTMTIKKILYLIEKIDTTSTVFQGINLFDLFNLSKLNDKYFITCSDKFDNLLNFSKYIPIYNYAELSLFDYELTFDTKLYNTFIKFYTINVIGNFENQFTENKLAVIYSSNISTLPYDYYYNKLEDNEQLLPVAVFKIIDSTYLSDTNFTRITVSEMDLQDTITTNDKLYISDYNVISISSINITDANTDVFNDYNGYIASNNIIGLSNTNIQTNLKNILLNCIIYNSKYLSVLYQNIFNKSNFVSDLLQIFVDATTNTFSIPTVSIQNTLIPTMFSTLTDAILSNFTYRDINDTGYNFFNEYITDTVNSFITSYQKLLLNYHNSFYQLDSSVINNILKTINKLTTTYNITVSNVLSNIVLNTTGYTQEYMIVHSTIPITFPDDSDKIYEINTNSFTLVKYINDITNSSIEYNTCNLLRNFRNNFINPITIQTNENDNLLYLLDDNKQIYKLSNSGLSNLLFDNNKYTELAINSNVITWSSPINAVNTNFAHIQHIFININHKYMIEKSEDQTTSTLYYITKLNDVIKYKFDTLNFNPTCLFGLNNKYFTSAYNNYITTEGLNTLDQSLISLNNTESITAKNNVNFTKDIDYTMISDYFHFQFRYIYGLQNDRDIYSFMIDKQNKIIYYLLNDETYWHGFFTDVISINNYIYDSTTHLFNSITLNDYDIINVQMNKPNPSDYATYDLFLYIHDTVNDKYYFDEYSVILDINAQYCTLTFIQRMTVSGDSDIPNYVYKFNSFYYEIYKQKIIKKTPVDNDLVTEIERRLLTNTITKICYNTTYIAFYYEDVKQIEISIITQFTNSSATRLTINYTTAILRNFLFDYFPNIDDTIDGITYTSSNNACFLYIIDENNNVIFKIIYTSGSTIQNNDNIALTFDETIYSKIYSFHRIAIDPIDQIVNIYTANNILTYNITTNEKSIFKPENRYSYLFDYGYVILSDYLDKIIIYDGRNSRIISGNYDILPNDIFQITNIQLFNIINTTAIVIINRVSEENYVTDPTQYILFIDNIYINLFSWSDSSNQFIFFGSNTINDFNNILSGIYTDQNYLYVLTYDGTDLHVLNVQTKLSQLLETVVFEDRIINGLTYNSDNSYKLYSNDNELFILYTDTTVNVYNTNIIQLIINSDVEYTYISVINSAAATQYPNTIPYVSNNIYLDNISDIKLIYNGDLLIQNDTILYYSFGKYIYKTAYESVVSIDAFDKYLYLYNSILGTALFFIIDLITVQFDSYGIGEAIFPLKKIRSLRSINIDDHIILHDDNNIYIYELTAVFMTQKHHRTTTDTIKSLEFSINNDVKTMYISYDTYIIESYIIDIDNVVSADRTVIINTYAKPYYIISSANGTTDYTKMPNVNYPFLQHIEYNNGFYIEYILGQEKTDISIELYVDANDDFPYTITDVFPNEYLYKILVSYSDAKDIRSNINDYTTIKRKNDNSITLKYIHYYENTDKTILPTVLQNIINNNNFDFGSDFVLEQNTIQIYNIHDTNVDVSDRAYSNKDITPFLTLNINDINNIEYDSTIIDSNKITIIYNTNIESFDSFQGNNDNIYNKNGMEYIPIVYHDNKIAQEFDIVSTNILLHTSKDYIKITPTYVSFVINNSMLIITYIIDSVFTDYGVSGYIHVEIDANIYIGNIVNINGSNDYLYVYYKILDKVNYHNASENTYIDFSTNYTKKDMNSLNFYNSIDTVDIDYTAGANYYNTNALILDYINYLATNIKEFDINSSEKVNYDIVSILNNIFVKQIILLNTNETEIINTNDTHTLYTLGFDTNFITDFKPIYLKLSHNFNNMIGYNVINNTLIKEIIALYLKEYFNYINIIFSDSDDYILNLLQMINIAPGQPAYITWELLNNKNSDEIIKYIYKYVKELIKLAGRSDDFDDFISGSINSSYFFISNINDIKTIYDSISDTYKLTPWNLLKNTMFSLNEGMSKIEKLLHGKFVTDNGIPVYLLNNYFITPPNTFNSLTYYLNEIDDNQIISYLYLYLTGLYNDYDYNILLDIEQSITDLYYEMLNKLFDGITIGTTTYKNIKDINIKYDVNITNIYKNKLIIPNNNLDPFIQPNSNGIMNLTDINTYLTDLSNENDTKITYYKNNLKILNISKINRNEIFEQYRTYLETKKYSTIISNTLDTITLTYLYDCEIGNTIGFYIDKYTIYKINNIDYATNTLTLNEAVFNDVIAIGTPVLIGINSLKLNDLSYTTTITANDETSITIADMKYVEIGEYVGFKVKYNTDIGGIFKYFKITDIDFVNNILTLDVSNKYNSLYPADNTLPINGSVDLDVIIGYVFNRKKQYSSSVYSSTYLAEIICNFIFKSLSDINNINYSSPVYWNYFDSRYKYFTPFDGADQTTYNNTIINNMNSIYKITDVAVLTTAFDTTFTLLNKNHTIDYLLSTMTHLINLDKLEENRYYKLLYMSYIMNIYIKFKDDVIFENKIMEYNIEKLFNIIDVNTDIQKQTILKLVNQTVNKDIYSYDIFKIDYIPINTTKTYINNKQYELILNNLIVYSHTYPYISTANYKDNIIFNLARILQLKTNTLNKKINDILNQLENIKTYYDDINIINQHMIESYILDNLTKSTAKNYILDKMTINNDHTKFDLYNGISNLISVSFESNVYQYPSDITQNQDETIYYNRDVIIDKSERAGYYRLIFQQLLIWKFILYLIPDNSLYTTSYYRRLPNNILYNITDDIDILTDIQTNNINYMIDLFINYFEKITITKTDNTTDILEILDMVDIIGDNTLEKWDTFIKQIDDVNLNFDYCSKLIFPNHRYYIAYILNKLYTKSQYTVTQFIYSDTKYKNSLNEYVIQTYTLAQHVFVVEQKNKAEFNIEDWIGDIDDIPKIYLCNRYNINNELELYKPYTNDITTYNLLYKLMTATSNMHINSDNIILFNYLLAIILNENMNYVESKIRYNSFADVINKYPTLYLVNGKLIRTTNLPDELYYSIDILEIKAETEDTPAITTSVLKINKTTLNKINNNSVILTYNIFQNTINKALKRLYEETFSYYDSYELLNENTKNIPVIITDDYAFINYNFEITNVDSNIITVNYIYNDTINTIDINTYFFVVINEITYYYFIDDITYNGGSTDITIKTELSDDVDNLTNSILIYGGFKNIISKILEDNESYYIMSNKIVEQYNDYINLPNILKDYIGLFYGNRYESNNKQLNITSKTNMLYDIIYNIIKEQHKTFSNVSVVNNYIDIDKLFNLKIPITNTTNNNIDIFKNVQNQLQKNLDIIHLINEDKSTKINELLRITEYPHNEYDPINPTGKWIDYLGHFIFDYFELYIGDQLIQKISDDYLHIYYQTNISKAQHKNYLTNIGYKDELVITNNFINSQVLYINLPWFFSNAGCNLPLISLISSKVYIKLKTKPYTKLLLYGYNVIPQFILNKTTTHFDAITYTTDPNIITTMDMTYIFLEDRERNLFATRRHEYLIEQIQYLTNNIYRQSSMIDGNIKINIGMVNCVKDIYWFCLDENNIENNNYSNYTYGQTFYNDVVKHILFFNTILTNDKFITLQPLINKVFNRIRLSISEVSIDQINISWFLEAEKTELISLIKEIVEFDTESVAIINSKLLLMEREILNHDNKYTNYVIPLKNYETSFQPGLNAYSFALQPNNTTQPSGSLNMSMLTDVKLELTINEDVFINSNYINIKIIGRNYNILRIFSGFGATIY